LVKGCIFSPVSIVTWSLDLPQQSADLASGSDGEAGQVDLDPIPGDFDAPVYVVTGPVVGVPDHLVVAHPLVQDSSQFCKDGRFMALGLLGETLPPAHLGVGRQVARDKAALNVGGDVCDGPGTADGDPGKSVTLTSPNLKSCARSARTSVSQARIAQK